LELPECSAIRYSKVTIRPIRYDSCQKPVIDRSAKPGITDGRTDRERDRQAMTKAHGDTKWQAGGEGKRNRERLEGTWPGKVANRKRFRQRCPDANNRK